MGTGYQLTGNDGNAKYVVTRNITAGTTQTQAGGVALTSVFNVISVCATTDNTVTLPNAVEGEMCIVKNNGANRLQIFPFLGDDLGSGSNASTKIETNAVIQFWCEDVTTWTPIRIGAAGLHGEMYLHANGTATTIDTADKDHALRLFLVGDFSGFTFDAGSTGAITDTANNGGTLRITDVAHGLATGDIVTINGLATASQNDITAITKIDDDTFDCDDITFATIDETGTWNQGSHLIVPTGGGGDYSLVFNCSMSAASANDTLNVHARVNKVEQVKNEIENKFSNADIQSLSFKLFVTLVAADIIWLEMHNVGGTGNGTFKHANLNISPI